MADITPVWGAAEWFEVVGLGAAAGAIGQGVRAVVGLKKVGDKASSTSVSMVSLIEPSRILVSLLIGAIAGVLAATTLFTDLVRVSSEQFFGVMAAGYAGADFIEGFIGRITPESGRTAAGAAAANAAPAEAAPASADSAVG